jgi:hypothetical protein
MKKVIIASLLLFPAVAFGQAVCGSSDPNQLPASSVLLCWTNATVDTAGTTLPAAPAPGSIKSTRIQRIKLANANDSCDFGTGAPIQTITVAYTVGQNLYEGLEAGKHCFRARHIAIPYTGTDDVYSDWAGPVSKVVTLVVPILKPVKPGSISATGPVNVNAAAFDDDPDNDE